MVNRVVSTRLEGFFRRVGCVCRVPDLTEKIIVKFCVPGGLTSQRDKRKIRQSVCFHFIQGKGRRGCHPVARHSAHRRVSPLRPAVVLPKEVVARPRAAAHHRAAPVLPVAVRHWAAAARRPSGLPQVARRAVGQAPVPSRHSWNHRHVRRVKAARPVVMSPGLEAAMAPLGAAVVVVVSSSKRVGDIAEA